MPRTSSPSQNTFLDTIATRFDGIHSNFVLGNAQANGCPIVYCSDGFCELTGFGRGQVMARGSGCRFLYGPETSEVETSKIAEALEQKREIKTEIRLYRKAGTAFWCLLDIVPIKNEKGNVVLFLVSHKDITKAKQAEDERANSDSPTKNSDSDDDDDDGDDLEANHEGLPENYNYGRRRSRAVLYHISGQLNKQNKAKSKLQQLNRLASQMPEYKVQDLKKSRFIIVHYGIFKIGWDWLILLCTFYIAIMVPFNAAFRKTGRFKDFMYIDAAVEVLFAIDIFLNFRTTFLNKSGQVVYESRLIAINYIRGWFLLDLLAAIPFDLLYVNRVETATMVHLLKVARLLRLARLLQKLERYNQYSVLVLALLMCMFALLAHWLACIWYAIGKAELDKNEQGWTAGWLFELSERLDKVMVNRSHNVPEMRTSYITALYFTCSSLTSVGFGNVSANTNVEKIFSVCAMLVGAIMHAVVFGNVTTIIQRMYARRATFHSKTKDLKDFFRIHHFPKTLKHRMRDYFQAMWSINNGIDVRQILLDFPEEIRGEIGLHLHGEILSLPIFQSAPPGCLKSVALQTDRLVCGPGEFILRKGDAINCLYYVCNGSMEVLKDEQVVAILGKGDIFGSDVDFDDPISISGCDVRSLAYCELLCIQVKGLVDALLLYPDFAETFTNDLPNDLTYNLREGHEDISDNESSTAAPVITLPSISEDEEEEDEDKDNNNDEEMTSKERSRASGVNQSGEEEDDEEHKGGQFSPLLNLPGGRGEHANMTSSDWLTSRGRLPNGHIATALSLRLANQQSKLKKWINRARKRDETGLPTTAAATTTTSATNTATTTTVHSTPLHSSPPVTTRTKMNLTTPTASSLALRRTSSGMSSRLAHRRNRAEKLKPCRTLPTLNSVSTERSIEQVMVHTLQMELEGTRDTVIGLERRLDDLHEDLSSISRNVDSLLRLVSQSPNPMYLSSHSLQPSYYNPSPSPHATNLYGPPSFYFSQSTVGDARDLSSGQSNSSPAPESWSGHGSSAFPRGEQFLSPFQAPSRNLASPSPMASPRINFSPSPMSNYLPTFTKLSPNNFATTTSSNTPNCNAAVSNTTASDAAASSYNADCPHIISQTGDIICDTNIDPQPSTNPDKDTSTGSPYLDRSHKSIRAGEDTNHLSPVSHQGSTPSSTASFISSSAALGDIQNDGVPDAQAGRGMAVRSSPSPPPPMLRGRSPPRPCNLSPLLPLRVRPSSCINNNTPGNTIDHLHAARTNSEYNSGNSSSSSDKDSWHPIPRSYSDTESSHFLAVPKTSASSSMSSVNSATLKACEPFASQYYHLTQLEPCDAALGHCEKARALRDRVTSVDSKSVDTQPSNLSSPEVLDTTSITRDKLSEKNEDLSASYAENLKPAEDKITSRGPSENVALKESPSPPDISKSLPRSGKPIRIATTTRNKISPKRGKLRPLSSPSSSTAFKEKHSPTYKCDVGLSRSKSLIDSVVAPLCKNESMSDDAESSTDL